MSINVDDQLEEAMTAFQPPPEDLTPAWRRRSTRLAAVAALSLTATLAIAPITGTAAANAADGCSAYPWMDTSKSADQRAHALLDASSLDQKLRWLNEQAANNPTQTVFARQRPRNIPASVPIDTTPFTMPAQVPCTPVIQYADGPQNVSAGTGITYFPAPIAQAAAWNTELAFNKGAAQGDEAWLKQRNVLLAPGLASGRDPRAGRTSEYLGEDALLTGLTAAAGSRGINSNPERPVESELKHFVANEQEIDRQLSSSNMDQRTLREIYTLPFEIAVDRGKAGQVMCGFNQVNNEWACGSDTALRQILKTEIGFDGFVVTDFGSTHHLTDTPPSLRAGLDQELNAWREWTPQLIKDQISAGRLTEADVDDAALRVVRAHIAAGLFDVARPATAQAVVTNAAHKAVSREVAEKGSVLLKNDGALPLSGTGKKIAVIGATAAQTATAGDVDASAVCAYGTGNNSSCAESVVPALTSITDRAAQAGSSVEYNNGADTAAAAAAARNADVAVVFGYYKEGEFSDRANISLDGNGDALIAAVAAANPNTIVVLQTGGPVVMPWLSSVKGVLETWYAGEQMGPATAALLFGDVNPSGKLPMTFPKSMADLPTAGSPSQYPGVFADGSTTRPVGSLEIRQISYSEGLKVGYRWYDSQKIEPLFPFGFGLSYAQFNYDKLQTTPSTTDGKKEIRIRFRLTNSGTVAGTETAQAYIELPSTTGEPSKRLVGWKQLSLAPGESRNVEITLSAKDLADLHLLEYWDATTKQWTTANGTYGVSVGGSFDTALQDSLQIQHAG
jgi:beta-glucosidase